MCIYVQCSRARVCARLRVLFPGGVSVTKDNDQRIYESEMTLGGYAAAKYPNPRHRPDGDPQTVKLTK